MTSHKKYTINIPKNKLKEGIALCLDNASSFLLDASKMLQADRLDHAPVPIVFAMEELGKVKILTSKINLGELDQELSSQDEITLTEQDGFLDHETKLKKGADMLRIPPRASAAYTFALALKRTYSLASLDPLTQLMQNNGLNKLKEKAKKLHKVRLSSSFIGWNNKSKEWELGHDLTKDELLQIIAIVHETVTFYQEVYS